MKIIGILLALILVAHTAIASESDELVCELNNGTTVTWQLVEQPQVEMLNGQFVVSTTKVTVFYAAEDVKRFTLNSIETAVDEVVGSSKARPEITYTPTGKLVINGCQPGEAVSIYAADGRLVLSCLAASNGTATVGLDTLPAGVYIVKSRLVNLKIARR